MSDDAAFLRAIADAPTDDAPRLVYADWLEERGDPRAEFLRLEVSLRQPTTDRAVYRTLCQREQALVRRLDPAWAQRVRRYTTPPPCRDIARLVPELAPLARTTIRLHPHRLVGELEAAASKVGGQFLWPAGEPWPVCPDCQVSLAPVVQLRARDVPGVAFPRGTDLFQLLWCPDEAAHDYQLASAARWRKAAKVTRPRDDEPDLTGFRPGDERGGLVPEPCALFPERVVEYPFLDDLYALAGPELDARVRHRVEGMGLEPTRDLAERFGSEYGPRDAQSLAFYELGQCPGSKVGGKPGGLREGRRFEHLLTLSTWEFDSASFRRWLTAEDQRLLARPGQTLTWARLYRECDFRPLQEATGLRLGRTQRAHVYVCQDCDPWEVVASIYD
ncbi:MAG TPA: TIGR02996 domain-containing protein [Gemmataceae bacterium]|jgi:uncharacterized protein (TIGR02996 family)|nr:TIGR02996 domain-containing protein [Gemmataceae bacterium]